MDLSFRSLAGPAAAAPAVATAGASIMAIPPPLARRNVFDDEATAPEARLGKKEKTAPDLDSEAARKDREHLKEFVRNYEACHLR